MWRHPGFTGGLRAGGIGILAKGMAASRCDRALLLAQRLWHPHGYIRAVNYHGTPPEHAGNFERHLRLYARYFSPVSLADLDRFLETGRWTKPKPGLIISFDDGLRTNHDVAAPLLERYGFAGWFFVPTDFISLPPAEQESFAATHQIRAHACHYHDGRIAMSWGEIQALERKHVVGCHTRSHHRLSAHSGDSRLEEEIVQSKAEMERRLNHDIDIFCWVGGEEGSYSSQAANWIRRAGYRYAFMTNCAPIIPGCNPLQLQRVNAEAHWPVDIVTFQLSGMLDMLYTPKRRRVNALTSA